MLFSNTYLLLFFLCFSIELNNAELGTRKVDIKKMEQEQIVPDVIDQLPANVLDVKFADDKAVLLGNELTPTQVKDVPVVQWNSDKDSYYTLAMVDPDAPSRADPINREFKHWLVSNIPGNKVQEGDVISAFLGSGPPKGSGKHRYVFLLYKQPNVLKIDDPRAGHLSRQNRSKFHIRAFAEKYNLGQPIAGNFYYAQWDPFVDERNKRVTH